MRIRLHKKSDKGGEMRHKNIFNSLIFTCTAFFMILTTYVFSVSSSEIHFHIQPEKQLFGFPVQIKIKGLMAGESVLIHTFSRDGREMLWQTEASYTADNKGVVDLEKQAPVSGSYEGVDQLGFFWSMITDESKENQKTPYDFELLDHITIHLSARTPSGKSTSADIKFFYQLPDAKLNRATIEEEGMEGIMYYPSYGGPYPAVILLAGSGGGIQEWWAKAIASQGFAALTLPYSRYKELPKELLEIPLEYFGRAIQWLRTQRAVNKQKIAVMGGSKGGELALLLGTIYPEIEAVVACAPSAVVWAAGENYPAKAQCG